jgi:hypothetical protein
MKIKVKDNLKNGLKDLQVVISDVEFCCDVIGKKPSIMFWLDEDSSDSLAFHLSTILQDRERAKKKLEKQS